MLEIKDKPLTRKEKLDSYLYDFNAETQEEMLEELRSIDPFKFEHLVCYLLVKMGYSDNGSAMVTQKARDGGVDCVLTSSDALGIRPLTLLVQCKRKSGSTGRPVIDELAGVVARHDSNTRGLVVTTGNFTKEAMEVAEQAHIALMGGTMLVYFMVKLRLGVASEHAFMLDKGFFDSYKPDVPPRKRIKSTETVDEGIEKQMMMHEAQRQQIKAEAVRELAANEKRREQSYENEKQLLAVAKDSLENTAVKTDRQLAYKKAILSRMGELLSRKYQDVQPSLAEEQLGAMKDLISKAVALASEAAQ